MSTTSSLEGWEVEQYLGPLSAHMVVATGILTDFFSGISDIFGGRSASYRDKIQEIEYEALSTLGVQARDLGADAIIGLRVDHDEISAGGKSMMMVTAMGTAVRARRVVERAAPISGSSQSVTAEALVDRVKRDWVLSRAAEGKLTFSESDWDTLIHQKISELAPVAIQHYVGVVSGAVHPGSDAAPNVDNRIRHFLHGLPEEETSRHLYDALAESSAAAEVATKLIIDLKAVDLNRVAELLRSGDEAVAGRALQTLKTHQRTYTEADIQRLKAVRDAIPEAFEPAQLAERSRMLSSKSRAAWSCRCGNEVDADDARCARCGKDRYGFTEDQLTPVDALSAIERRITALQALLEGGKDSTPS